MANTYGESAHNDDGIITGILREMEATAQDSTLKLFTTSPPIKDALTTESTAAQSQVIEDCLPYLSGFQTDTSCLNSQNIPKLERGKHIRFLENSIKKGRSVGEDAYRPWILYWSLTGLNLLGKDVKVYRESVAKTLAPMQNAGGGFGGGPGQRSHLAPSYAAVLSLATVGGDVSLDLIDRRSLWKWLGQLKQNDGGFRMCVDGEEDVRGTYCAITLISLLSLPLDLPREAPARAEGLTSFLDGLPDYVSRCQTFEGGISGRPQSEAHSSYAFCALASLCMVGPPHKMLPEYLDLPLLLSWLSARQYAPEGGFSGRTNKLVDGCYSHWVGGCWPLISAALKGSQSGHLLETSSFEFLYSAEGLTRYIMSCCQHEGGGLRDKPDTFPDAYHSCYVLAGLSSLQYLNDYSVTADAREEGSLNWATQWSSYAKDVVADCGGGGNLIRIEDRLAAVHPLYVIPWAAVDRCYHYFAQKRSF